MWVQAQTVAYTGTVWYSAHRQKAYNSTHRLIAYKG